ncbi:MAG: DUF2812 domain-containing protein [Clostridia bacterium]|nr:DUF2812 domain-containing protein [Clostridia bacterium]
MKSVYKIFFGFMDLEKWLNKQGEKCLQLTNVSDSKYTFIKCDSPIRYFVDHTDDSPFTDANGEYIHAKEAEGYELVCMNGRTLFFCAPLEKEDYSQRYKNMLSHVRLVLLSVFSLFVISMSVMIYEMKQIKILEHAVFERITPRTVAYLLIVPAALSLGATVIYFMEMLSLSQKRKEVVKIEQLNKATEQDQVEGDSAGV